MKHFTITSFILVLSLSAVFGQKELLQSGPMVGHSAMREAGLWVQTNAPADVRFDYRSVGEQKWSTTDVQSTNKAASFVTKFFVTNLEPGTEYEAQLRINDQVIKLDYPVIFQTQKLWQYREDPPAFSFLAGSCFYNNEERYDRPGNPYGQDLSILKTMSQEDADFMMWLGDNTYLREVDYDSRSGVRYRFTRDRSVPELQPLLGGMHHYAIWDDHDYGPNDSDRSYWGKSWTEETFNLFWMNPVTNVTGKGGITGGFNWSDCQFFLLDNRYFRTPHAAYDEDEFILGDDQISWLVEALRSSSAQYKFICIGGQFLSNAELYENHATYPRERDRIISLLDQYNVHGVVFLTGDRHSSEISRIETHNGNVFYDITSSAVTSKTYDHHKEPNTNRVPGSMVIVNNYAVIDVSGPYRKRSLKVTFKDREGTSIYEYDVVFPKYDPKRKR